MASPTTASLKKNFPISDFFVDGLSCVVVPLCFWLSRVRVNWALGDFFWVRLLFIMRLRRLLIVVAGVPPMKMLLGTPSSTESI
jgi:hypothetical protein